MFATRIYNRLPGWIVLLLPALWLAPPASAQCDLKVLSAYTCDANGNPYKPHVGDIYYIRINWSVTGTPKSSYSISFQEANLKYIWTGLPAASGTYWGYVGWQLPLAGAIPYTITLDPDKVTGDTNYANNTIKGQFTPTPPASAVAYYDPLQYQGSETFTVTWNPGSGSVDHGFIWQGVPTTDTFQTVLSATGPAGAQQVMTAPNNQPVWETDFGNFTPTASADTWSVTQSFIVEVSSVAVNPTLLNKATWAQLGALTPDLQAWTQPDALVQSTDPTITSFVSSVLPANYQKTMTPYSAARKLFLGVVKRLNYQTPCNTDASAVATLQAGEGDCLGFSTLFAACLRSLGIPARTLCGWWKGQDQWHCIMEFYLPGAGWVPADGSEDKLWWDPTGKYACMFGDDPVLNQFCEVSRGSDHHTSYFSVTELQVGWWEYWGTASYANYANTCSLQ